MEKWVRLSVGDDENDDGTGSDGDYSGEGFSRAADRAHERPLSLRGPRDCQKSPSTPRTTSSWRKRRESESDDYKNPIEIGPGEGYAAARSQFQSYDEDGVANESADSDASSTPKKRAAYNNSVDKIPSDEDDDRSGDESDKDSVPLDSPRKG